jgi:hypothetical protein
MLELLNVLPDTVGSLSDVVIALCTVIELWRSRERNAESEISKPILRMEDDDHWKD